MFTPLLQLFAANCHPRFLGLIPWYEYLDLNPATCQVNKFKLLGTGSDIPLVLVAVVDDLVRIAGLVAVGFVIYGGIMYTTSQGQPEETAKAQSTIINALIGLAVAVLAVSIVAALGTRLQ